jgi:hypothetical protein
MNLSRNHVYSEASTSWGDVVTTEFKIAKWLAKRKFSSTVIVKMDDIVVEALLAKDYADEAHPLQTIAKSPVIDKIRMNFIRDEFFENHRATPHDRAFHLAIRYATFFKLSGTEHDYLEWQAD